METDFEETMADVVRFLGLRPYQPSILSGRKRFCVTGKTGVMDEQRSGDAKAGTIGDGAPGSSGVAECHSSKDKVRRNPSQTECAGNSGRPDTASLMTHAHVSDCGHRWRHEVPDR